MNKKIAGIPYHTLLNFDKGNTWATNTPVKIYNISITPGKNLMAVSSQFGVLHHFIYSTPGFLFHFTLL